MAKLQPFVLPAPNFDWFITTPSFPRIQAFHEPIQNTRYAETFVNSNLTVLEGRFLILVCAAFYNVTWTPEKLDQDANLCSNLRKDEWPSRRCIVFQALKLTDSGVYTCHQTPQSDPCLVTKIRLNVLPKESKIIKRFY